MFHKCSIGCWVGTVTAVLIKQEVSGKGNLTNTLFKNLFNKTNNPRLYFIHYILTSEGNPVTCGGDDTDRNCYKYEAKNDDWTIIGQLIEAR